MEGDEGSHHMKRSDKNSQLQRPLPTSARGTLSAFASSPATEEMLITRPGSRLVDSLASRSVNLVTVRVSMQWHVCTYPEVTMVSVI